MSDRLHAYSAKRKKLYIQNEAFLQRRLARHPKSRTASCKMHLPYGTGSNEA